MCSAIVCGRHYFLPRTSFKVAMSSRASVNSSVSRVFSSSSIFMPRRSATDTPASCYFMPMICSSEKRLRIMPCSLS